MNGTHIALQAPLAGGALASDRQVAGRIRVIGPRFARPRFVSSTAGGDLWVVGCTPLGSARTGRGASPLVARRFRPVAAPAVGRFGCFAGIISAVRKRTHDLGELAAADDEQCEDEDDYGLLAPQRCRHAATFPPGPLP